MPKEVERSISPDISISSFVDGDNLNEYILLCDVIVLVCHQVKLLRKPQTVQGF